MHRLQEAAYVRTRSKEKGPRSPFVHAGVAEVHIDVGSMFDDGFSLMVLQNEQLLQTDFAHLHSKAQCAQTGGVSCTVAGFQRECWVHMQEPYALLDGGGRHRDPTFAESMLSDCFGGVREM